MRKMTLLLLPALALALFALISAPFAQAEDMAGSATKMAGSATKEEALKVYEVGDDSPDFTLPDGLTGKSVNLSDDILGKKNADVVALTFMNTACSACQAEVSLLSRLAEKHKTDLKVYLIAVDMRGEKLVKAYDQTYHYNVSYLLDPEFTIPPMFGFNYTPALVVLNKKGKILYKKGGYNSRDTDALIDAIEDLL